MTVKTSRRRLWNNDLHRDQPCQSPQTSSSSSSSKSGAEPPSWAARHPTSTPCFCSTPRVFMAINSSFQAAPQRISCPEPGEIVNFQEYFLHHRSTRAGKQSRVGIAREEMEFLWCSQFNIALLCLNEEPRNLSQPYPKVNFVANTNNPSWPLHTY